MRITIVGLGVLGTSLGLGLKAATSDIPITGHDPDPDLVARAKKAGAIDDSHWNLVAACREADLVVLDLIPSEIEPTLTALREDLRDGAVVLDTAPIKAPVMEMARRALGPGVSFIGGHVVSPALTLGRPEPSAELVRGAPFVLVVPEEARPDAADASATFATAVGAEPRFMDALEHDGVMAATAQLPLVMALAVAGVLERSEGRHDREDLAGGELAALGAALLGERAQTAEALLASRELLLPWVDDALAELGDLRDLLAEGDAEGWAARYAAARQLAGRWLPGASESTGGDEQGGRQAGGFWRDMLLGALGRGPRRPRG